MDQIIGNIRPQQQHYQIRTEEEEGKNKKVQWEVICDCFPVEDEETEEELRRLALTRLLTGSLEQSRNVSMRIQANLRFRFLREREDYTAKSKIEKV